MEYDSFSVRFKQYIVLFQPMFETSELGGNYVATDQTRVARGKPA